MSRVWLHGILLAAAAAPLLTAPVPEPGGPAPALIVRFQPVNQLLADGQFLAEKFGNPKAGKLFEAQVAQALGVDSLDDTGLDRSKPSGMYVFPNAELEKTAAVAMLPVADVNRLLAFVGKWEVKAEKLGDDFYSLSMPQYTLPVFVRVAQGYAYVTAMTKDAVEPGKLLAPATVFGAGNNGILSCTLRPDRVPEPVRKEALAHLTEWIAEQTEDIADELDKNHYKLIAKWADLFATGGREASLRISFDRPSGELAFDVGLTPKPDSKLAEAVAAVKTGSSLFGHMVGAAGAINVAANTHLGNDFSAWIAKGVREGVEEILRSLEVELNEGKTKDELNNLFDGLFPKTESGDFDAVWTFRPGEKKSAMLAGIRVIDGKKCEAALKKLAAVLPAEAKKKLRLDVETVSGFAIHAVETDDLPLDSVFGPSPLYFGFRDNAVILGYGENAAKQVGEALAGVRPAPAPTLLVDITLGKLQKVLDETAQGIYPVIKNILGTDDRLRLLMAEVQGGSALKARASVSLQVIFGATYGLGIAAGPAVPANPVPPVPPAPPPAVPPGR